MARLNTTCAQGGYRSSHKAEKALLVDFVIENNSSVRVRWATIVNYQPMHALVILPNHLCRNS